MYKGFYYIYIVAKNSVAQKKKVLFQMINHLVFLLFSLYLYKYVYTLLPGLKDKLPFENAVWSMSIYFMVFWLGIRTVERKFRDDMLSGNIEMYILRPLGYIWQKVFVVLGQGLLPFFFASFFSIVVNYLMVGWPNVDMPFGLWLLAVLIIFILSQILNALICILAALSGFWLHSSESVYFLTGKLVMIFGGAWVPIAFFPKGLQLFAQYSPFGASMAVSFTVYPNFNELFPFLFLSTFFWSLVCMILVYFISRRAFKNLAING
jgi:ABC-2 type transport system permease protein